MQTTRPHGPRSPIKNLRSKRRNDARRMLRKDAADLRNAIWRAYKPQEQLAILATRRGSSTRQRTRILASIQEH